MSPASDLPNDSPDDSEVPESAAGLSEHIVFFDGVCGFCNTTVNFLMARDANRTLRFASLQGETAARLLSTELREQLDTLVLVSAGKTFVRSAAVVRILQLLGGFWGGIAWCLWLIPFPLRDLAYRGFSKVRYRLFGRQEACRLPVAEDRGRILE